MTSRLLGYVAGWFYAACYALAAVTVGILFPLRVSGTRQCPRRGGLLVVSNHQSFLDPIVLGLALARSAHFLARSDLFRFMLFRWLILALNAIKLERTRLGKEGMKQGLGKLNAGEVLVLWPEGTRTAGGHLGELHPGVLLLIRRSRAPVVVAGIAGAYESWPRSRPWPWPAPIWVHFQAWQCVPEATTQAALEELRSALLAAMRVSERNRRRLVRAFAIPEGQNATRPVDTLSPRDTFPNESLVSDPSKGV